ncbi:hypothetical protein [Pseudomonas nicosulfuronedens]
MSGVRHKSLAITGTWRITTFGNVVPHKPKPENLSDDLRILTKLRRLDGEEGPSEIVREVPIGEIPLLLHDTVLVDGHIDRSAFYAPRLRKADEELDYTPSRITHFRRLDRTDGGELIIPAPQCVASLSSDFNAFFVGIERDGDPYHTIIPAIEVFRFFYATSDRVTKLILSGAILDRDANIFHSALIDDEGNASLALRRKMKDNDAPYLARFAFDPYAYEQAQAIYAFWAAAGTAEPQPIRAMPIIAEPARTTFLFRAFKSQGRRRRLVTHILSCYCPLPFNSLSFSRDNDGRKAKDDLPREASDYPPSGRAEDATENEPEVLEDVPPGNQFGSSEIRDPAIGERFPALGQIPVAKEEREETKTKYDKSKARFCPSGASNGTVIDGRSGSSSAVPSSIVGPATSNARTDGATPDEDGPPIYGEPIDVKNLPEGSAAVISKLKWIAEHITSATVEFKTVLRQAQVINDVPVNIFPSNVSSKRWIYTDADKEDARFVLVAEVTCEGKVRYVTEFQQVEGVKCSTIVFWNASEASIENATIKTILMSCARNGRAALQTADIGILWGRLAHSAIPKLSSEIDTATRYLARIRDAKVQSEEQEPKAKAAAPN